MPGDGRRSFRRKGEDAAIRGTSAPRLSVEGIRQGRFGLPLDWVA
jgi:hypothetical protein